MLEKEYLICYVVKYRDQNFHEDLIYRTGEKMNKKLLEDIRKNLEDDLKLEVVFTNVVCLGEIEDE